MLVELKNPSVNKDKQGNLWLPKYELINGGYHTPVDVDLVKVGESFFDVIAFSPKRDSYWIKLIDIEGAADNLEKEVEELGG